MGTMVAAIGERGFGTQAVLAYMSGGAPASEHRRILAQEPGPLRFP